MEGGQYLAQAASFAQSAQCTPWILSKIALAGLHDLLSLVSYLCVKQEQPSDLETGKGSGYQHFVSQVQLTCKIFELC